MNTLKCSGNRDDRSAEIQNILNAAGACFLEEGVYYAGGIDVPKDGFISGCGAKTVLILPEEAEDGYLLKIQENCTVQNLRLAGSEEELDADTMTAPGKRHGILFSSNYDGLEADPLKATRTCLVSNLFISDFSGGGITGHNTGYSLDSGMCVENCVITRCGVGVNLDYWTEFNKFVNVSMTRCHMACVNNGGNNVFANCTFHGTTGLLMDNRGGKMPNNSHGTVTNSQFAHCGHNKGNGIEMYNMTSRFLFSSCTFGFDSVRIADTPGVLLNGCLFIRDTEIEAKGESTVLIANCIFSRPEQRPIRCLCEPSAKIQFSNCLDAVRGDLYAPEIEIE